MDARKRLAVAPVVPDAVFSCPAVLDILLDLEVIGEVGNVVGKVRAVVAGKIFAVVIRIKTVLDLILFLRCQRFEHMEVSVDIVTEVAADRNVKQTVAVPCRAVAHYESESAQHAQRVGSCGIYRLALCYEVAHDRQLIALRGRGGEGEVLIGKAH